MAPLSQRGTASSAERTWGMFPPWVAATTAYAWLGLAAWVLIAPRNGAPAFVKAACIACWLAVGFWVWERTDQVNDDYRSGPAGAGELLFRFGFTLAMGALAMCIAGPIALARRIR